MTEKDGKIISATENELFSLYLRRNMDDVMSFDDYLYRMQIAGVKIVKGGKHGKA